MAKKKTGTGNAVNFQVQLNVLANLPGTAGQKIYASGMINTIGTAANAPAGFMSWGNYKPVKPGSKARPYSVAISEVSTLSSVSTTLIKPVVSPVNTTTTQAFPAVINTTIARDIPYTIETNVGTGTSSGTLISVTSTSGIVEGMSVSGGKSGGGSLFQSATVTKVNQADSSVTVSSLPLNPVDQGAPISFTSPMSLPLIKVTSAAGIVKNMIPSGGIKGGGTGFAPNTLVLSVSGNSVTLNQDTLSNTIDQGAPVSFTTAFNGGTTVISVASTVGIVKGMIPYGGIAAGGNAFTGTTVVTAVNAANNTVTVSEASLTPIDNNAPVRFTSGSVNQISVQSTKGISYGMSVRGGTASPTGDAFNANTFVLSVDTKNKIVTLSDWIPTIAISSNSTVQFYNTIPSQVIGTVGQASTVTLSIPGDSQLSGCRIIFTIGQPGNFSINSSNIPIVPVPYKGNVVNNYYDFIEFAWTFPASGGYNFNYDTSIVDQFGLPVSIQFAGVNSTLRGIQVSGNDVGAKYNTSVPAAVGQSYTTVSGPSAAAVNSFFTQLASVMNPYRILAPADAFLYAGMNNAPQAVSVMVSAMSNYYDWIINQFLGAYTAANSFSMTNVNGSATTGKNGTGYHDLQGNVTTISQQGTDGQQHTYTVLQLTDITPGISAANGSGWVYNIYSPFFSSNGYSQNPPPPYWLNDGTQNGTVLPTAVCPSQMVFGASGVFADSDPNGTMQPTPAGANATFYQTLLGAIENQIVTAITRGLVLAPQWRWLYQAVNNSATLTPQVTVNANQNGSPCYTITMPSSAYVPVCVGMSVVQTSGTQAIGQGTASSPNVVTGVSTAADGTTTVTLSLPNLVTADTAQVALAFSYQGILNPFYQLSDPMQIAPFNGLSFGNNGNWDYFAQFFHLGRSAPANGVSIGGLAYAYAFDDQGNFSTDISMNGPDNTSPPPAAIVNIGAAS